MKQTTKINKVIAIVTFNEQSWADDDFRKNKLSIATLKFRAIGSVVWMKGCNPWIDYELPATESPSSVLEFFDGDLIEAKFIFNR